MIVLSEASSWASAIALRTVCPRMEPGRSSPLPSAFVSMTTRSLVLIDKDFGQLLLGHPSRGRTLADAIAEALKLVRVERAQPVVFLRRENYSNVAVRPIGTNRRDRPSPTRPAEVAQRPARTFRPCRRPTRCGGSLKAAGPRRRRPGRAAAPGGRASAGGGAPRRAAGTIRRSPRL